MVDHTADAEEKEGENEEGTQTARERERPRDDEIMAQHHAIRAEEAEKIPFVGLKVTYLVFFYLFSFFNISKTELNSCFLVAIFLYRIFSLSLSFFFFAFLSCFA